jgi:beta-lactamase superfamily II metal-dependent hydrolase
MAKRPAKRKSPSRPKRRPPDTPAASQASQQPATGKPTTATTGTSPARSKITIRFYCQGIGDCHLLKFTKEDGGFFWMLIDCGIHSSITGGPTKIGQIVDDIASVTKRLDVIVLTHEHWDHNSGFFTARDKFKQFSVGEVWLGWTEDPSDPQARQLDKFKSGALNALQQTSARLNSVQGLSPHLSIIQDGLQAVMGFNFGAKGEKVRSARDAATQLAAQKRYLEPSTAPISLPGLSNTLRIYVLGPPRDAAMLGITDRPTEMYGLATGGGWSIAAVLGDAFTAQAGSLQTKPDNSAPFNPEEGIDLRVARSAQKGKSADAQVQQTSQFLQDYYDGPVQPSSEENPQTTRRTAADPNEIDQSWRRIDNDWLGVSSDLAIQLDDRTNNSSLVLAFEFLDTKRVLLFVGDAQVGNWLSWGKVSWKIDNAVVTGPDLLARTVFYKVGHHGSHNATLKQRGLELMTSADLSAFIPTNAKDALKVKWGGMPFEPILADLAKRTNARVIRADDAWIAQATGHPGFSPPAGAILALRHDDKNGLWVEMDIA